MWSQGAELSQGARSYGKEQGATRRAWPMASQFLPEAERCLVRRVCTHAVSAAAYFRCARPSCSISPLAAGRQPSRVRWAVWVCSGSRFARVHAPVAHVLPNFPPGRWQHEAQALQDVDAAVEHNLQPAEALLTLHAMPVHSL